MYNVHGPKFEIYITFHPYAYINWVVQNPMFLKVRISMPQTFQKITHLVFEFPLQFVIRVRNQYVCVK